jgi:hypothetical protein
MSQTVMPAAGKRYWTRGETAEVLRCCEQTVDAYVRRGLLAQPVRLGRKLLFDAEQVLAALQGRPSQSEDREA